MTDRELMQQVLEALEGWNHVLEPKPDAELISALRSRLAQPVQEPIATVEFVATVVSESGNQEITMSWWHEPALPVGTKLYTTPTQRKPLTDEEISDAVREADFDWHYGWTLDDEEPNRFTKFARAIEAKLREKNGGGV